MRKKLPKEVTTITIFSRSLSFLIILFLPFLGFGLGMLYEKDTHLFDEIFSNPTDAIVVLDPIQLRSMTRVLNPQKFAQQTALQVPIVTFSGVYVGFSYPGNWDFVSSNKLVSRDGFLTIKILNDRDTYVFSACDKILNSEYVGDTAQITFTKGVFDESEQACQETIPMMDRVNYTMILPKDIDLGVDMRDRAYVKGVIVEYGAEVGEDLQKSIIAFIDSIKFK